jgi:glutathione S-transferase
MKFDLEKVELQTHKLGDGRSYCEINPKGYVPALQFDDGEVLTENVAILTAIADRYPALIPPGQFGRYRLLEMLAYLSTHKSFHPLFSPAASDAEKEEAKAEIGKKLEFITSMLKGPYLFGEKATGADAYLFTMLLWAGKQKIALSEPLRLLVQHMRSRPTVKAALRQEGLM